MDTAEEYKKISEDEIFPLPKEVKTDALAFHETSIAEKVEFILTQQTLNKKSALIKIELSNNRCYAQPESRKEFNTEKLKENIFLKIRDNFSNIKEVESIYIQEYREELQIRVYLNVVEYNDELMDTLLNIEYDIINIYDNIIMDFLYIPKIVKKKNLIHPQARCIYKIKNK